MRPHLHLADPDLLEQILAEAKRILAEIGMEVHSPELRRRLSAAGLPVQERDARVYFPPDVVDQAIAAAPASFTLWGRQGASSVEPRTLGQGQMHFAPGSSGLYLLDHRSAAVRMPVTLDLVEAFRLVDGLEHISFAATSFSTGDVAPQIADAWRLYLALTQTRKPLVSGAFTAHGVPRMAEMLALFRHDRADLAARPLALFTITASGNFRYSADSCQNLLDCLAWGIPVEIVPLTIIGLVAPVTPVGAAIFHVADALAGISMAQVLRPGHPVLFGGGAAAFHMREATSPLPAVEALRHVALYTAVGRHLGLPTQAYTATSESKQLDAQAGAETWASAMNAALAGVDLVSGPGMLNYLLTFHLPKLVVDNEICGQVLHFLGDVAVREDAPALELARSQLQEGHLLTAPHTQRHWPQQMYLPGPVWDRRTLEGWQAAGSPTLWQRAVAEVEARLAAYEPLPTDPAIDRELRRLLRDACDCRLPDLPPAPSPQTTTQGYLNTAEGRGRRGGRMRKRTRTG